MKIDFSFKFTIFEINLIKDSQRLQDDFTAQKHRLFTTIIGKNRIKTSQK